ncbi:MAG: hypothetical protein CMJ85_06050 [Planctomycetes bacterium]|nr:hypothetical protein [Planctomycetota bacterium]
MAASWWIVAGAVSAFAFAESLPQGDKQTKAPVDPERARVDELIGRMEKSQQAIKSLRATLELTLGIPAPDGDGSGKMIEMRALMRVESMRRDTGRYTRIDVDLDTPQGPVHQRMARTPDGIRIHRASEFTGESWLKVDKETMKKLDRAAAIFGSSGALRVAGASRPGAVVGAELLKGLGLQYRLKLLEAPVNVDGQPCHAVHALIDSVRAANASAPAMPTELPEAIHLYFSQKDLLLRRMVQMVGKRQLATLTLQQVEQNPKLLASRFELVPPDGVRFKDILTDELGSIRIKMDLKRLEEHDARIREAKQTKNVPTKSDAKKSDAKKR